MMLHIFDVSGYQGTTLPAPADASFVKATEGSSFTSGSFSDQWTYAKDHVKVRGAYHFARPEQSSGNQQADRFLSVVDPVPGEVIWLDLETSQLSQGATNAWAKTFGDRLRTLVPGVKTGVYTSGSYASTTTGAGLADHFDLWWYPQYPGTYQLSRHHDVMREHDIRRAINRSDATPDRSLISGTTSGWPSDMTPYLPAGLTIGWAEPHIWQFTDNWRGFDASISSLTIDQLAGGGAQPTKETDMIARDLLPGLNALTQFPIKPGAFTTFVANTDNTYTNASIKPFDPVQVRVAILKGNGYWQTFTVTVGRGPKDQTQPQVKVALADPNSTFVSITRVNGTGDEPVSVAVI